MGWRVGFGYDVHQLVPDRKLVLGGIDIKHVKGSLGHSDGDALIHSICDALLGALALRDIGFHFPDTDPKFKGIDSKILLSKTMELIHEKGWKVNNVDATVCLENPKINPHIPKMTAILSELMHIHPDQLSIKATTNEKMGFVGTGQGVAAYTICSLSS